MKIDGKEIAAEILDSLKPQVMRLKETGIIPTLAIILIGNDQSSRAYIKQKKLKADEIGAEIKLFQHDEITQDELIALIHKLNDDSRIHGIIVQRPLPEYINKDLISRVIKAEKDVDGFNDESSFDAPVALAVIEILKKTGVNDLSNKKIAVIGKGETAGLPVIKLLDKMELSFSIIDSKTENREKLIKNTDILISAVGKENIITPDLVNKDQILVGIGLFQIEGKLKGDYEVSEIEEKVKYFTPTIGGVGPVNVAFLLKNLLQAVLLK